MSLVIVLTAKTSWGANMAPKRAIALLTPRPTFLKWMNEWMNEVYSYPIQYMIT
jgi:hypothetical protein